MRLQKSKCFFVLFTKRIAMIIIFTRHVHKR